MPNPPPAETIDLNADTLRHLKGASTATIATLLYKRGYHNAYVQGVAPLGDTPTMVGPAYTLRYIPARPDTDPIDAFREPDHPQRVAIGLPIACGGVAVYPGDIALGGGVMIIPRHLADEVALESIEMELFEAFVLEQVRGGASIKGLYPPTDPQTLQRFATWRANIED